MSENSWEVLPPVLFNTWKHHAGALRRRIGECVAEGERALAALAGRLVVIGADVMELYTGPTSPAQIRQQVLALLERDGHLDRQPFEAWLREAGGHRVVTLPEDGSRWVLRLGDQEGRYVHVHPGRGSPATRRVRANVLKTAVMVLAYVAVHGGDPCDVEAINDVRRRFLGLAPLRSLAGEQGLRAVIDLLGQR